MLLDALSGLQAHLSAVVLIGAQAVYLRTAGRLKDAGDVYRLFDATAVTDLAAKTRLLLSDERSSTTTDQALSYLRRLFATPRSPGTRLAVQALTGVVDEITVAAVITGYTRDLIGSSSG